MFFFDFTSQSVGSPFAFDTMLRSAVPPHIGQSPVPGSEAETRTAAPAAIKAKATLTQRRKAAEHAFVSTKELLCDSAAPRRRVSVLVMLFILRQFQIIDVRPEFSVDEEPRRPLQITDRIRLVDLPRSRFGPAGGPRLAARAHLAVGKIL